MKKFEAKEWVRLGLAIFILLLLWGALLVAPILGLAMRAVLTGFGIVYMAKQIIP